MKNIAAILLAGGRGRRMNSATPKQYLLLHGKPVVQYSLDTFLSLPQICEVVVVCDPHYRKVFQKRADSHPITFALPGKRRQDSAENGFHALTTVPEFICIHDSARPLISPPLIQRLIDAANECGAATVGLPLKFTVKECDANNHVIRTPKRDSLWEIQTPQLIRTDLLQQGFALANQKKYTVTDDVSVVELLKHPVKVVEGCSKNIKMTTAEDYYLLKQLLEKQSPYSIDL